MQLGNRYTSAAFATKNRLGKNRKERLLNGMRSGRDVIKRSLVPLRNRPNFPVGLSTRMALLGW